ncbi:hypothetical protein CPC16_007903 [Podila verticillata]|nr:hypothetical protein BGZ52_003737 [Haplosporangium bisporale]KAF9210966.1 hypothetical protein BGZ59_008704 [Podila verticillata]KAF9385592.1 hypothetical protein CPC16_007903 [Podila verticillata]KAI9241416.1 MAG: meiotically up-regulated gene family-domain-containing protein [Podila humilis]KFH70195.1 hypothetical protein MVEG_04997 [Podila verticillata NRRL 6337]
MVKSITFAMVAIATVADSVLGFSDNCSGSGSCNKGMSGICTRAFNRYTDGTVYNDFTLRTNGQCTAIYRCNGAYPALTGSQLKGLFASIYGGQGCKGCGSHAFNGGQCEVTLDFCSNCVDSGNPN